MGVIRLHIFNSLVGHLLHPLLSNKKAWLESLLRLIDPTHQCPGDGSLNRKRFLKNYFIVIYRKSKFKKDTKNITASLRNALSR